MRTKHIFTTILCLLLTVWSAVAQSNTLTIPDVSIAPGREILLPVNLDNTADIVGVQFSLTVPEGLAIDPDRAALSGRANHHELTMAWMKDNRYLAIVYSSENAAINGRSGVLLSIPLYAKENVEEGSIMQLTLSDVALAGTDGSNLVTDFSSGTVSILSSPDLQLDNVSTNLSRLTPGESITLGWTVTNVGGLPSAGGWREEISLVATDGTTKYIGTTYYEDDLEVGAILNRQAEIRLPEVLGIDGEALLKVRLYADNLADPAWLQNNNEAYCKASIEVERQLFFRPRNMSLEEVSGKISLQLIRSGSTANENTFTLTAGDDARLSVPTSVVILQGEASAYVDIDVKANGVLDPDSIVYINAMGNDYPETSARLKIIDDTNPQLTLLAEKDRIVEGEELHLTIGTSRPSSADCIVSLQCDHPHYFEIPDNIVILAGHSSTDVVIKSVDDDLPDMLRNITFVASSEGLNRSTMSIELEDNDLPILELEIIPNAIAEDAGARAMSATLRRSGKTDGQITVMLSDDSQGRLSLSAQQVTLPAGVSEVTFSLGPIDNTAMEGTQVVNVRAAVYISSCGCDATGQAAGVVTVPVTIFDNDGPSLDITASTVTVPEGEDFVLTVTRNNTTDVQIAINLVSSHDDMLQYEHNVMITAGQTSVEVPVHSIKNTVSGDTFTATFTASADNYNNGSAWVMVTDQSMPDAHIASFTLDKDIVTAGEDLTYAINIGNTGITELKAPVQVRLFVEGQKDPIKNLYTDTNIQAGHHTVLNGIVAAPDMLGPCHIYADVNGNGRIAELNTGNNTSESVAVSIVSPVADSNITTDRTVYHQCDTIAISGNVTLTGGQKKAVELYILNNGTREAFIIEPKEDGSVGMNYVPQKAQGGHFSIGLCYPGEMKEEEMASFDVYGITRVTHDYITCQPSVKVPYTLPIKLKNQGRLPLNGMKATVLRNDADCSISLNIPEDIAADEEFILSCLLTSNSASTGNDWEHIKILVGNDQCETEIEIFYYSRNNGACLSANISEIKTTMTLGQIREYPFTIKNIGNRETGDITLDLPSWIKSSTPGKIASIESGENATIVLQFTPTDEMQLNVPLTGYFSVCCQNGDGLSIPFQIEPVSETEGTLIVDVCDEYTYYTAEAPHVSGAKVVVSHPTTGQIVAQGFTASDGTYRVTIPEGYYSLSVTADKHSSYRNNILINPGAEPTIKVVDLSYQAVTYTWDVEETTVEDSYLVETTVEFETSVPRPVVEFIFPKQMPLESHLFEIVATNHGLITAHNVSIDFPDIDGAIWDVISDSPDSIPALQTVVYTCRLIYDENNSEPQAGQRRSKAGIVGCIAGAIGCYYTWYCGLELQLGSQMGNYTWGECSDTFLNWFVTNDSPSGGPGTPYNGGDGSGSGYGGGIGTSTERNCNGCEQSFIDAVIGCLPGVPGCAYSVIRSRSLAQLAVSITGCRVDPASLLSCILSLVDPCGRVINYAPRRNEKPSNRLPSYAQEYIEKAQYSYDALVAKFAIIDEFYRDPAWYECDDEEYAAFVTELASLDPDNNLIEATSLLALRPQNISTESILSLVDRLNNTYRKRNGMTFNADNILDSDAIDQNFDVIDECQEAAIAYGYENIEAMMLAENEAVTQKVLDSGRSSVCASVTLKFSQAMSMTRQAFRGTLSMHNGNMDGALSDIKLSLVVKDEDGVMATSHEMQISTESLTGFTGNTDLTSGWSLDVEADGVATILFIPTVYAAPTHSRRYSFGGTLSYVDPTTGSQVVMELAPVTLTINPSPMLNLDYFMQRDVLGDDALTEEVEPSVEAEFSLLINNVGYGDATNVRMVTQQPQIIDNQKGLLIDFELVSSQLNGDEKTLALGGSVATEFGTIPAHKTAYAQWWFTSSLLGHFINYDVEATHLTSYDNPDLSLLGEVNIHELVKSIDIPDAVGENIKGFLTNDFIDANDTPDMLYCTDGTAYPVSLAQSPQIIRISDTEYELSCSSSVGGWVYGSLPDPSYGTQMLVSASNMNDGQDISLRNIWQTSCTLKDSRDPIYENRIHFVDRISEGGTEVRYHLVFEPKPEHQLQVVQFIGVPAEGEVSYEKVNQIAVQFNKEVDPTTFTNDDLSLMVQGVKQDVSKVTISSEDNRTFLIDLSLLHAGTGYYLLTVNTSDIMDSEGFYGENGKSVGWICMAEDALHGIIDNSSMQTIYRTDGTKVNDDANAEAFDKLSSGLYIVYGKTGTYKIMK